MTFALVVWSSLSYAQMRTEDIYDRGERRRDIPATGIIDPDAPVDSIGGKKERRQKRPMESYLFVDSVRNLNAFSWRHNPYNNNVVRVDIDTMLSGFNRDYIFFQNESIGNVYLTYRNNGTRGMYNNQKSKDKNLSIAFAHTGPRYTIHGGYIYNMGDIQENGGLVDDREVTDTVVDLPQNLKMNLKDARNVFKGNTLYYTQTYGIPLVSPDSSLGETIADVPYS